MSAGPDTAAARHRELGLTDAGERVVRFAYSSGGSARRGLVSLRERDVARLLAGLRDHPALAAVLRIGGGG